MKFNHLVLRLYEGQIKKDRQTGLEMIIQGYRKRWTGFETAIT